MRKLFFFLALVCSTFIVNAQNFFVDTTKVDSAKTTMFLLQGTRYDNASKKQTLLSVCHLASDSSSLLSKSLNSVLSQMTAGDCFVNLSVVPNSVCPFEAVTFSLTDIMNFPIQIGNGYYIIWSTGQVNVSSITLYPSNTVDISATVQYWSGGQLICEQTLIRTIVVKSIPLVNLEVVPNAVCMGEAVQFTLTDVNHNPLFGWPSVWSTGQVNVNTVSLTPTVNTQVSVITTDPLSGCSTTLEREAIVYPKPSVFIEYTQAPGETVALVHSVPGATYLWTDNTTNQFRKFTQPTLTFVVVTAPNGCTSIADVDVYSIFECPPSSTDTDTVYINCGGECVLNTATISQQGECGSVNLEAFSNGIGALLYSWSNGMVTKKITVTQSGDYTVTVTDVAGCTATSSIWITINSPSAKFTTIENGESFSFYAEEPNAQYAWTFGDNHSSTERNPAHEYGASGNFTVTLAVTKGNCTAFSDTVINVSCIKVNVNVHHSHGNYSFPNEELTADYFAYEQNYDVIASWTTSSGNILYGGANHIVHFSMGVSGYLYLQLFNPSTGCTRVVSKWVQIYGTVANGIVEENPSVLVYPNPSTDIFNISLVEGKYDISLFDSEGKLIEGFSIHANVFEIKARELPSGVYNLQITGENLHTVERLVVQR